MTLVLNEYEEVIVVEDDLVVAEDFIRYMNGGLDYYRDLKQYGSICAYSYPIKELQKYDKDIYVTRKGDCWGWGTWQDRWKDIDWEFSDFSEYKRNTIKRIRVGRLESGLDKLLIAQSKGEGSSWAVLWFIVKVFCRFILK